MLHVCAYLNHVQDMVYGSRKVMPENGPKRWVEIRFMIPTSNHTQHYLGHPRTPDGNPGYVHVYMYILYMLSSRAYKSITKAAALILQQQLPK